MKSMVMGVALAGALAAPSLAQAQGKDELWEVTSQMNAPGMPAGMGAMTHQVCQDRDPAKQSVQGQNMEGCRITERRQSGNTLRMTVACPDGNAVIEQTYNAARTEYKGSMRMGDMVMNMSGRKVGSCDAQQARRQQDAQQAAIKSDVERAQAQTAAEYKRMQEEAIQGCAQAVATMDVRKMGTFGRCNEQPELCNAWESAGIDRDGRARKACTASRTQFCSSYQTPGGYAKAQGSAEAAKFCGVDALVVKASLCPKAAGDDALVFLGRYCPVEAKPLAQQHCAGRDFTAMRAGQAAKDKYFDFCTAYLANADLQDTRAQESRTPSRTDQVKQGVDQGINRLKGLFGR